ncbi:LPS export ABC transporter permease LptF [Candidatus Binatus soli]|jgi:lipopolysaccharide export system permease protein|uniref:LPS export ABC transporter permease LptF n=1 Tax=Candidatus Binatus soli TaxID=1953413 RepID=UPI003D104497
MRLAIPGFAIIDRYVAREVLAPFAVDVGLLTFALVTGKLLKLMDMVVNHGVSLGEVMGIMGYIMPAFLELTFPMAVLLGVLMGFGRMSSDQEMTAARACGISLYRLAVPVMMVALGVYALSSYFAFSLRPWANSNLRNKLYELSQTRTSAGLKEKVFNSNFPGLVVYVDEMSDTDSSLKGVMISDARDPHNQNTIIAKHGMMLPDAQQKSITLRLSDGSIFGAEPASNATHVTSFKTYDLSVSPESALGVSEQDPGEMTYSALRADIETARAKGKPDYAAETERAGKFTVPFATMLFALLGISLGLKPARGGHSERFGVSVALFFLYYSLMRVGETLAQRGKLDAWAAMSIPDIVFMALAFWFFYRAASDKGDQGRGPGDIIWDLVERFERSRQAA